MHPGWRCRVAALLLMACAGRGASAAPATPQTQRPLVITDVTVVDVEHDRSLVHRTVVVEDGRIAAILAAPGARLPVDAERVDGSGRYLIPGLVDMHVHLFNLFSQRPPNDWTFAFYIAHGVTAVREMCGDPSTMALVRRWREQLERGQILAPRILAAGIPAGGPTPDDARHQVDAAADAGADFVKVFSGVPEANWRALMDEARRRRLPAYGHVPAAVPLLAAAAAGQRTDEHLMQAYEACSTVETELLAQRRGHVGAALDDLLRSQEPRALAAFDAPTRARVIRALAAAGQAQVPTLVLADEDRFAQAGPADADPLWRHLRADERRRWQAFHDGYAEADAKLATQRWSVANRIVAAMRAAGVTLMAGTDSPMPGVYPGRALHEELALLVAAGLSPREALRAATLTPATFLGIADRSGSIAVGKRADLVLLDADPARDIHNTRRIEAVVLAGRLLRRADLDALLAADAGVD